MTFFLKVSEKCQHFFFKIWHWKWQQLLKKEKYFRSRKSWKVRLLSLPEASIEPRTSLSKFESDFIRLCSVFHLLGSHQDEADRCTACCTLDASGLNSMLLDLNVYRIIRERGLASPNSGRFYDSVCEKALLAPPFDFVSRYLRVSHVRCVSECATNWEKKHPRDLSW